MRVIFNDHGRNFMIATDENNHSNGMVFFLTQKNGFRFPIFHSNFSDTFNSLVAFRLRSVFFVCENNNISHVFFVRMFM